MMTSEQLNEAIRTLEARDDDALDIDGGKSVPYVGWFWREVDFDAPHYEFGIIPGVFQGFMENNKWDYGYSRSTTPDEWAEIKRLLEAAVTTPTRETVRAAWDYIQAI